MTGVQTCALPIWKRLTIAVELVSNPSIIFMDEPTSGLDARAAAIVMWAVRNTVNTGRTVVCIIHQPSIDIFESFDEVLPSLPISNYLSLYLHVSFSFNYISSRNANKSQLVPFVASTFEKRRAGYLCW